MSVLKRIGSYIHNVLVAEDQAANVVIGGKPDETISSRSQRAADAGNPLGKAMTKFLHLFQRNHGVLAEQGDLQRAKTVEEIEQEALDGRKGK